jgi:hypothetical protein
MNQENEQNQTSLPPELEALQGGNQTESDQEEKLEKYIVLAPAIEGRTHHLFPLVGYGILLFTLLDYLYILIPLQLTNPAWEFQTIGRLVEQVWAPLLGLMFVFYRRRGYIRRLEVYFLRFLSWLTLLLGIIYLLMMPLGVNDTRRIHHNNLREINQQIARQNNQFMVIKTKFNEAKTPEDLQALLAALNPQGKAPEVTNVSAFKQELLTKISEAETQFNTQIQQQKEIQRKALMKNSVKWNVGAIISGVWFIMIWVQTAWVRKLTQ